MLGSRRVEQEVWLDSMLWNWIISWEESLAGWESSIRNVQTRLQPAATGAPLAEAHAVADDAAKPDADAPR